MNIKINNRLFILSFVAFVFLVNCDFCLGADFTYDRPIPTSPWIAIDGTVGLIPGGSGSLTIPPVNRPFLLTVGVFGGVFSSGAEDIRSLGSFIYRFLDKTISYKAVKITDRYDVLRPYPVPDHYEFQIIGMKANLGSSTISGDERVRINIYGLTPAGFDLESYKAIRAYPIVSIDGETENSTHVENPAPESLNVNIIVKAGTKIVDGKLTTAALTLVSIDGMFQEVGNKSGSNSYSWPVAIPEGTSEPEIIVS